MNRCLTNNSLITSLANEMKGEPIEVVKGLIELWQDKNNKDWDTYPTLEELQQFKAELRRPENIMPQEGELSSAFKTPRLSSVEEQAKVFLTFDGRTRMDRVNLIARLFSNEIDYALQEHDDTLNSRIKDAESEGDSIALEELKKELESLDRFNIIKAYTPAGLFMRVQNIFNNYVQDTEENRIQSELNIINSKKGSEKYSDEQKYLVAKQKALYKTIEYQKVLDNFRALAEEASSILISTEGIRVDLNYLAPKDGDLNSDTPEGDSVLDELSDDFSFEEMVKEGWMSKANQVSNHDSLSQAVRKAIMSIPRLNHKGKAERDDLGFPRYLDASYVHATLINELRDMVTSDDMLPLLTKLSNTKVWVKQVINKLEGDPDLFSQFYQDFRKDFLNYWIQKRRLQADGTYKIQTISINKPEGTSYLLDKWRDNYEGGITFDDDSIYNSDGKIIIDNARKGLKLTESLNNKLANLSFDQKVDTIKEESTWSTINKLLHMVGIDPNQGLLLDVLTNSEGKVKSSSDPVTSLLTDLHIIFSGVSKGDITSESLEAEDRDLINIYSAAYGNIATLIAEVTEDAIESSVRDNDKSYYSHVTPNYLGKLIKQLKNVSGDDKRFKDYIQEEFGKYDWFFKDGRWRSDWLNQIVNNPDIRKGLNHKVVLSSDRTAYQDWDDLDYTLVLLTEYFAEPTNTKSDIQWANYHVPILSDSPSAEFIRFRKYTDKSIVGADGEYMKYEDIILNRLTDLVSQELDRIALVNQRDEEYQKGNPNITSIANFDIVRYKDGEEKGKIKSIGGAEFKFLPALNDLRFENGESFLDRFQRIQRDGTGEELRTFIRENLRRVIDNEFENTIEEWYKVGLFDETNGKYNYLDVIGVSVGQSANNASVSKALHEAKKLMGNAWSTEMESLLRKFNRNLPVDNRIAIPVFDLIKEHLDGRVEAGDISMKVHDAISNNLVIKNPAKDRLREYFWNSKLATSQIIELTTTDLAFYDGVIDLQKRFKEVHAPALRLNTNSKYGRKWEKTIYLKDNKIKSFVLDDIATVLDERVKKHEMSSRDRDLILNKFKEVNVGDAQAYRSLSSYRAILDMSGQWTDDMENAFNNFQKGNWNIADFNIIWQTKKPFLYTQISNSSGIQGYSDIKTPVQNKNSEFLLLAMHKLIAGPLGNSSKLVAINEFMEDKGIDVVQFESSVKVGKQGVIDLNKAESAREVRDILNTYATPNGVENPNVVHKVSYEDYGIQTATPEHSIDAAQLVGTQIRKLITADIDPGTIINVDGRSMLRDEWLRMYDAINTENVLQSYLETREVFKDAKKVEEVLLEEVRGSRKYGADMVRACTLDNKGEFTIPLFEPIQSLKTQNLLNSVIKNRITKQKIRGGALIQVSSYGLTKDLNIVFEGEGENKRIKYLECYMPAYSRKFYEPLMKSGTHELDINKLPEDLRKLIGYRIPTEDKYSMAPLMIKGFLPQQNGSAIMLPADITTLSGSDFDVDKMYIMLPEFNIVPRYNKSQFIDDLISKLANGRTLSPEYIKELKSNIEDAIDEGRTAPEGSNDYNIWRTWQANKNKYRVAQKDKIEKVKYDWSKTPAENSLAARNNLLIDMIWGVLTNSDTASKILNPGGFDYAKKAGRICTILRNAKESDLRKELGVEESKSVYDALSKLDLEDLNKIAKEYREDLDPLNPRTQVILHQQNMTGANMIGLYANHNANHALIQHTMLGVDTKNGAFRLDGKKLTSLHEVINDNKEFISKNNANFLAASVDNTKDPILKALNQNMLTGDPSMLLSRLGYNPIIIGLLMNQPVVRDITTAYFRDRRLGKDGSIDLVLEEYRKNASMMGEVTYSNYINNNFYAYELADNILMEKEIEDLEDVTDISVSKRVKFYENQVAVGMLFKRISSTSDALSQLVQATRSDTQGGAAGPTIADTQNKHQKVADFIEQVVTSPRSPLTEASVILPLNISGKAEDDIRRMLLESPLPYLQAFYTLGVSQAQDMLSNYYPQFSDPFEKVLDGLRNYARRRRLNTKTINNIYNDLLAYIMSKTEFFGNELVMDSNKEGAEYVSSAEKRKEFINNFPSYFLKVVGENADIAELEFIKRLSVQKANRTNPVDTIVFRNVGQLTPLLREKYSRDWTNLLYMGEEAQSLALNLLRYSYYRNGFAFGPNTFIHLASVIIRQTVPDYISTLRSLLTTPDDYTQFIDQYVYNHLDNRQLVPEIPKDSSIRFEDKDGKPLDQITITIDSKSNISDRKAIREVLGEDEDGNTIYDLFNYITRRDKSGNNIYYRKGEISSQLINTATYNRIDPLGFKNSFIEYEYGKDVSELKSVISKNDRNYQSVDTTSYEEADIDYNDIPTFDFKDFVSTKEIATEAFQQVYNESPEVNNGKSNDILSIEPNLDYRDASNNPLCLAPDVFEL